MELDLSTKRPGELLRIWRAIHDIGQDELATRIGISAGYLSRLEAGTHAPSLDLAAKIEREFGIKAAEWVAVPEIQELAS
jgi:transcriptional regulator with XRE-family HTH domain